jgi:tricorn protease
MHIKSILGILSFFLILLFSTVPGFSQSSDATYFASDPAVSPDGQTVIFVYESDIWQVPASGGRAVRLTGMDGEESAPTVSPDGQRLAFTSNQYGNNDVYIMPLAGGEIRQLSFHQADDEVESWSWKSDSLYFRSDRYNRISAYAVSTEGGTPRRLFGHYHNTVHDIVQDPTQPVFYFNESWESFIFPSRKRYKGPFNPDIKSYNTKTKSFTELTDWEGKDFWPTIDEEGNLYFVSDEANEEYNLYALKDGQKEQLTDFNTSVRNPSVSANGQIIAFEKEYRLFSYNTASGEAEAIPISISENQTLSKTQSFNTGGEISALDVSPDQKKMAFVSRGELFISDSEGTFVRKLTTDPMGRVLEVKWKKDSKDVVFNQTVNGYQNWFTMAADGTDKASRWTDDARNNRMLALNPERTQGVYLSGRDQLRLLDLASGNSSTIAEDEFWGFQNEQPRFSPNGKWITYTAKRDFEDDIFVYKLETEENINLTKTGVSENGPFWGPRGDYIYFSSARTHPSYPRGGGNTNLFRMALHPMDQPYKSEKFNELFKDDESEDKNDKEDQEKQGEEDNEARDEEGKDKAAEKDSTITIDIQEKGLMQRLEQIGPSFGSQFAPYVVSKDDKRMVLYGSNHKEGETALWKTTLYPFKDPETVSFEGIESVSDIAEADGNYYALSGGSVYTLNIDDAKAEKIEIAQAFDRNLQQEFDQMFDEMWANIEENYYIGTFHETDWQGIRDRYRTYLPHIHSRSEFSRMMNDMLGELNSSHIGFSTFGEDDEEFYETVSLATGILFGQYEPYTVARIVADSPADVMEQPVQAGDLLTAVDGEKVDSEKNRERYFNRPEMPDELALTFSRDGEPFTTKIHPASYGEVRTNLYDEWENRNQQRVDRETDRRVAYVHMKNMGGGELDRFLRQMNSEAYKRDGLILDLRYNTGGNVHDAVLQFLSQRPYLKWKYREGALADQPNFAPAAKPIVLLINEQSLSDAEVTATGFKQLELGTVMGTETYRWIIFTSGKGLVDGSFYRLPSWGVYTLDGNDLEKTGVAPDISVDNTFKDRLENNDPQLERAIDFLMEKMK